MCLLGPHTRLPATISMYNTMVSEETQQQQKRYTSNEIRAPSPLPMLAQRRWLPLCMTIPASWLWVQIMCSMLIPNTNKKTRCYPMFIAGQLSAALSEHHATLARIHSKQYRSFRRSPSVLLPCNPRRTLEGFSWGCMVIVLKGSFQRT